MVIIVNGGRTIVNGLFVSLSYLNLCTIARVPERLQPTINIAYPDGRNCTVVPGGRCAIGDGMIVNVTITGCA